MPVYSIEKVDGMRRAPQRVFPPNGLKYAKNILTSVEDNIFQVSSPIASLYAIPDPEDAVIEHAIKNYFEGTEKIFLIYSSASNLYFAYYDGSKTVVEDLYNALYTAYDWRLLAVGSSIIVHPFYTVSEVNLGRKYYKSLKYTRNNVEYDETDLFGIQSIPTSTDPLLTMDVISKSDMTDDIPIVLGGSASGYLSTMVGYQLNGYESICSKNACRDYDDAAENVCIRIDLEVNPSKLSKITSGIDIYLVQTPGFPLHGSDEYDWMYVDNIPMDRDEEMVGATSCSVALRVITCSSKTWAVNQWKGFVAEIGGNYHLIESSTADTLTVKGSPSGVSVKIHSRWIEHGGEYYISKYITADEGDSLIDRCGVSNLKIESDYDYCPVANYIEYFKGFVWMADYVDRDNERRRNRLITNIINSEGLSCYSVYDTDIYIEFKSDILGLKAYDDYMFVLTGDGIYTVRFTPGQDISSYTWTAKKISDLKIPTREYSTGYGNISFLFDNYRLFTSDGYDVKLITNDEINLILNEYTTSTNRDLNAYSILYCEQDSLIYLCLEEVLTFKGGVIEREAYIDDVDIGNLFGTYKGNPVYYFNNLMKTVKLLDGNYAGDFDVEFHNTDLNTKEDKYFIQAVAKILKGTAGTVYIKLYLDDTLMKTITLNSSTAYDQSFDIRLPKSNTRRFSKMYFKMDGSTWGPEGIQFELKALDIEIEPIRRTVLS